MFYILPQVQYKSMASNLDRNLQAQLGDHVKKPGDKK